ncbi:MAG: hypothetical protein ACKVX7_13070 [Planctomycetota bacterium]
MSIAYRINGQVLASAETVALKAMIEELVRQGWTDLAITVDGHELPAALTSPKGWSAPRAESGSYARLHEGPVLSRVEITGTSPELRNESPADLDQQQSLIRAELFNTLPRFIELAQELGEALGRGEWSAHLARVATMLEELQLVLDGLRCAGAASEPDVEEFRRAFPALLAEIDRAIKIQSWVEVADTLLYEFVPRLKSLRVCA